MATKVFIDRSGSTTNQAQYWQYVTSIVSQTSLQHATFYTFDVNVTTSSRDAILHLARQRGDGDAGTRTSILVPYVHSGDSIVIVTDGQVTPAEVRQCDENLRCRDFKSVEVHFQGAEWEMNLSVSAPFTRNTPFCRLVVNGIQKAVGNTTERIDLQPFTNKPLEFLAAVDQLHRKIVLKTTGRRDVALREDLIALQKQLLNFIASNDSNGDMFDQLRDSLGTDYNRSVRLMTEIIRDADTTLGKRVADAIQVLIKAADGNDFSLANLEPSRLTRAVVLDPVALDTLSSPAETMDVTGFTCPISFEDDIPMCFIAEGTPILAGMEKSKLEDLLTNPLLFLQDDVLVSNLIQRLDFLIGSVASRELYKRANTGWAKITGPTTRRTITSALTFGTGADHIKATNFALADLFFGDKLVGNAELWLAVVYFIVSHLVSRCMDEPGFIKAFEVHLVHRLRTTKKNLTLSALPIEPMIKAPMDIAIWYCTVSPFLTTTSTNRLRDFGSTAKWILKLSDLLGHSYERADTLKWMSLYRAFGWMMNQAKAQKDWSNVLRAQYQNSIVVNGRIIFLDGPATDGTRPRLGSFAIYPDGPEPSLRELLTLAEKYVNVSKKTSDVYIPLALTCVPMPTYRWNYCYAEGVAPDTFQPTLSPATYRPLVISKGQHWLQCSTQLYGDLKKQISLYNYFIHFVQEFDRYPKDQAEYILYVADKQAAREKGLAMDTLPAHMLTYASQLFANYETVLGKNFANVSASDFKKVTFASMRETDRKRMDGSSSS